jgi:replicative DNA helicase
MTVKDWQSLRQYEGEDQVISSHELKLKLSQEKSENFTQVKSQIPSLDKYIEDFRDGELIVISGPTKNGKTLLAETLTVNFTNQNHFALWFTFEVPPRQFLSHFSPALPLIFMPSKLKAHAMDWLESRILESFLKYQTRIIFIDHLHYIFDMARSKNTSLDIGVVIRKLKTIAVENNFVIFLLCHTTKGKSETELSYESIRDSSIIAQESDAVMMVKRVPEEGDNRARVRLEFHRRTGFMEKVIHLEKIRGYLREVIEIGE